MQNSYLKFYPHSPEYYIHQIFLVCEERDLNPYKYLCYAEKTARTTPRNYVDCLEEMYLLLSGPVCISRLVE